MTKANHHGIVRDKTNALAQAVDQSSGWQDSLSSLNERIAHGEEDMNGAQNLVQRPRSCAPKTPGKQSSSKGLLGSLTSWLLKAKNLLKGETALHGPLMLFVMPPKQI